MIQFPSILALHYFERWIELPNLIGNALQKRAVKKQPIRKACFVEIEKKTMQNEDRNIIQRQNKVTKELLESKLCGVP